MPNQLDDRQLLRQYVQNRSADAFEQIVRRYAGIVLASAQRQVRDMALAEDVTQAVFIVLTKKAPSLVNLPTLGGWLMKVARYAAIDAMRKQNRQRHHEQAAATERRELQHTGEVASGEWAQLSVVLDDAIAKLGSTDRNALVLRYFQEESYSTIASKLGMSEEAVRKRVGRALEKLRGAFSRRGIAVPATAIAAGVTANASVAVSPALFGSIITGAPVGVTATGLGLSIAKGAINMMNWAKATMAAAVVGTTVLVVGGTIGMTYVLAQPVAPPPPARAPAAAGDRVAIQGTWQVISYRQNGQSQLPGGSPWVMGINDREMYRVIDGEIRSPAPYSLDPEKNWLDQGPRSLGIYELRGNTLRWCFSNFDTVRPTVFADGPSVALMVLQRIRPSMQPNVPTPGGSSIQAARADLSALELAMDSFSIDTSRYPTSEEGLSALLKAPAGVSQWRGPYIAHLPRDPWGHPYFYQFPGKRRALTPDLWSSGPDGKENTEDDITSGSK